MNILHVAPYFPSKHAKHAGGVTMGLEVETLRNLGHKVYSLSFVQVKHDYDIYQSGKTENDIAIKINGIRKFVNFLKHPLYPIEIATRIDSRFEKLVNECLRTHKIDFIHAEYASMIWLVKMKKKYDVKFAAVLHDVYAQNFQRKVQTSGNLIKRILYKIELIKIKRYEKKFLSKCDAVMSFSDKDKKLIKDLYGVDSLRINLFYDFDYIKKAKESYCRKDDGYVAIFFMGQMGRKENNDAALRLIKIFSKLKIDKTKLYIIGVNPSDSLLRCASSDIVVTGYVENIEKFIIENCDVACFPLLNGAGVKIKVLESLMLGVPVITNEIGAEGIDENGECLVLAESDQEFERRIRDVVEKKLNVSSCLRQDFSWDVTEKVFRDIYGK